MHLVVKATSDLLGMRTSGHGVTACARVLPRLRRGGVVITILTIVETCREDRWKAKHSASGSELGKKSIHIFIMHFRNKINFHLGDTLNIKLDYINLFFFSTRPHTKIKERTLSSAGS